ncbi:MAG: glycerol-3-phosphate acyltransferase [Candidatus Desulfobacillus denitrificans]|jgi:glycerol-3-phosphate acyltransferase PlsY|uniref:Glycerol-3-phosphate acyltransferase n=1 Tax=Candidatus Desulfobacillus denitrificans TaxID=2608985 RepID=A0A809R5U0_9PROT|nr:glycerol-3-phosphate 1-O-acyltransferase PlsY [Rhodocyclaceae bacterium]OQY69585.1 MAG: glycerol-3-phosphate acyltransferase [Rhodocyclaceae bacterium UTPRO2]BBO19675.1 glycerol-3-phosphate acyltransferase [Candidatus Desulfobacillus denitrificans]GIK46558.1 MAG: glycerol-3-phosphate acyltransferase [Betaproteobacteria bacterium]MCL4724973.1 glycerol-3-phosphate 1-O-acyltransferase PlsY [Rhodocyclaceae bacterium]
MTALGFAILAYLIGSVPFAVVTSKLFGLADPRSYGSGNPGATNVLRSGNRLAALLTLLGDAAKGWLAVFLVQQFGGQPQEVAIAGFAAFFGHLHPVFLNFKGGKGVATAAGVLFGFSLWLGLAVLAVWIGVVWFFRYSSLGAIAAAIAAPLVAMALLDSGDMLTAVFCIALLLFWRHSGNLQRIRAGSEPKIGEKKSPARAGE